MMRVSSERDHVVNQGTVRDGSTCVEYYTTSPSPSQWVAIGVVLGHGDANRSRHPRRMLVGRGGNEASAIADLKRRFAEICRAQTPAEPARPAVLATPVQVRDQAPEPTLAGPVAPDAEPETDVEHLPA